MKRKPVISEVHRFTGSIIGSALGDAIGEIVLRESVSGYKSLEDFEHVFGKQDLLNSIRSHDCLQYTDDTAMSIGVMESLIDTSYFNPEGMGERFVSNYIMEPWRGYGNGPSTIFSMVGDLRVPYQEALRKVDKTYFDGEGSLGNGAAMRAAPIGTYYHDLPDKELYVAVEKISRLTHTHPVGIDGTAVLCKAISMAILKDDPETYIDELIRFSRTDEIRSKMRLTKGLLENEIDYTKAAERLGMSVRADESVPFAIYSFLKHPLSFEDCLLTAIFNGGDADTVGAMASAISGAFLGISAIHEGWITKLENRRYILALASRLHEVKRPGIHCTKMSFVEWRRNLSLESDEGLAEL